MALDAGSVFVNVGAKLDSHGFSAYDRAVAKAKADSRHAIEAALRAKVDTTGFTRYGAAVDSARGAARSPIEANLRANVDTTGFSQYEGAVASARAESERMGASSTNLRGRMGTLGPAVYATGKALGPLGLAAAFGFAAKAGIGFNATMEQNEVAFKFFLGSAEAARDMVKDLFKVSAETPFEFTGVATAAKRLLAFGTEAKDVIPTLTSIGDAIAGLGGGTVEIDRVVTAIGQIRARGIVSAEELNQLRDVGINAGKYLQDAFHLSGEELANIGNEGIKANKAIPVIIAGLNKDFGGMSALQAKTLQGQWSTALDNVKQAAGEAFSPLSDSLRDDVLPWLNDKALPSIRTFFKDLKAGRGTAGEIGDALSDVAGVVGAVFVYTFEQGKAIVEGFVDGLSGLGDALSDVRDNIVEALGGEDSVNGFIDDLKSGEGTIGTVRDVLREVGEVLGEVVVVAVKVAGIAIVGLIETVKWLIAAGRDVGAWFASAADWVKGLIPVKVAIALLTHAFGLFLAAALPALKTVGSVIDNVFGVAKAIIVAFVGQVKAMGRIIGDVVEIIGKLLHGDFKGAWESAKDLVGDVIGAMTGTVRRGFNMIRDIARNVIGGVRDFLKGAWGTIESVASKAWEGISHAITAPISAAADTIKDVVNWIISNVLNRIPGVELDTIGGGAPAGKALKGAGSSAVSAARAIRQAANRVDEGATGMRVTTPMFVVGEEAPQHPEYVLATNPAYRGRNVALWAAAGRELGIPGFFGGGVLGGIADAATAPVRAAGDLIGKAAGLAGIPTPGKLIDMVKDAVLDLPDWLSGLGGWIIDKAGAYIKDKLSFGILGGGSVDPGVFKGGSTLGIAAALAQMFGLSISSSYRSPAYNASVGGVPGSLHTHGSPSNPGAIDFTGSGGAMSAALAWAIAHLHPQEAMIHDVGSGLHLHLGFFAKGGVIGDKRRHHLARVLRRLPANVRDRFASLFEAVGAGAQGAAGAREANLLDPLGLPAYRRASHAERILRHDLAARARQTEHRAERRIDALRDAHDPSHALRRQIRGIERTTRGRVRGLEHRRRQLGGRAHSRLESALGAGFGELSAFEAARAELFGQFGSDFVGPGGPGAAFGPRFFGAAGGSVAAPTAAAGTNVEGDIHLHNYFREQPVDPHTWSRGTLFELRAAV